jgi:hypothetical protein
MMTWTYSGDPTASDRDEVRFLITDTMEGRPLIQDEEIDYALSIRGDASGAVLLLIEVLIRRYSLVGEVQLGRWRLKTSDLLRGLRDVKDELLSTGKGVVWAGGIDKDEWVRDWADDALVQPYAWNDIHKNWDV